VTTTPVAIAAPPFVTTSVIVNGMPAAMGVDGAVFTSVRSTGTAAAATAGETSEVFPCPSVTTLRDPR